MNFTHTLTALMFAAVLTIAPKSFADQENIKNMLYGLTREMFLHYDNGTNKCYSCNDEQYLNRSYSHDDGAQAHHPSNFYVVPSDRLLPPGLCRIWYDNLPLDRQPPAMQCGHARKIARHHSGCIILERTVGRGGVCGCGGLGLRAATPNSQLFKGKVR